MRGEDRLRKVRKDLTHLLKGRQAIEGFEDIESAREYVARYLLNYISLELSGLPEEEWERTLSTWIKICAFARSLVPLSEEERNEIYRKNRFDMMMEGIAEDLRHTIIGLESLGFLKKDSPPEAVLRVSLELIRGRDDLVKRWELDRRTVEFMFEYFGDEGSGRSERGR